MTCNGRSYFCACALDLRCNNKTQSSEPMKSHSDSVVTRSNRKNSPSGNYLRRIHRTNAFLQHRWALHRRRISSSLISFSDSNECGYGSAEKNNPLQLVSVQQSATTSTICWVLVPTETPENARTIFRRWFFDPQNITSNPANRNNTNLKIEKNDYGLRTTFSVLLAAAATFAIRSCSYAIHTCHFAMSFYLLVVCSRFFSSHSSSVSLSPCFNYFLLHIQVGIERRRRRQWCTAKTELKVQHTFPWMSTASESWMTSHKNMAQVVNIGYILSFISLLSRHCSATLAGRHTTNDPAIHPCPSLHSRYSRTQESHKKNISHIVPYAISHLY